VLETNPGSFASVKSQKGQFTRLYIAYVTCVEGYLAGYKFLIFLDGTFLKDRYKGTLLATITYDDDNGLFPPVFCVCDIENHSHININIIPYSYHLI